MQVSNPDSIDKIRELNEYVQLWDQETKLLQIIKFLETEEVPIKVAENF